MVFSSVRWSLKAYEDLNYFQRLIYRFRLKKWLSKEIKKDFYFSEFRVNNPLPDKSYNDYIKEYFNAKS